MKKFLILLAALFSMIPTLASADSFGIDATADATGGLLKKSVAGGTSVEEVVGSVINIALSMVGIIFFVIIVYAGFNWMIARGNDEQVTKSKSMIEGAVIGLIIVMAAYAITKFVFQSLDSGVTASPSSTVTEAETPPAEEGPSLDLPLGVCETAADGTDCGDNSVCKDFQCIAECENEGGTCGTVASCTAGTTVTGKCPGDETNVCCKP